MGRNTNRERGRRPNDAQPWRRMMGEDHGKQPTPLKPVTTRNCARCGAAFINVHPVAACFCHNCQHIVSEGWED